MYQNEHYILKYNETVYYETTYEVTIIIVKNIIAIEYKVIYAYGVQE